MTNSLAKYFRGVGAKRLTEVEINPSTSNQHEFNGINEFQNIFGTEKIKFTAKFILLNDEEEKLIEQEGFLTWYDARKDHPTRSSEYRLYYSTNEVIDKSSVGDLAVIAMTGKDSVVVIVAPYNSTSEKQLMWLFDLQEVEQKFIVKDLTEKKNDLGFAGKYIISSLGFEIEEEEKNYLDLILKTFGDKFPSTIEFSRFARSTMDEFSPDKDPDEALLAYLEREEILFRTLERYIVETKLKEGFGKNGIDVDEFIQFSLSVQNRRKSRAGLGFENQLAYIFKVLKIQFTKKGKTENNYEPDFLFPGIESYNNPNFNSLYLTMLGLKTTAKERWRQILPEANRIWPKHLITLEPAISKNQTDQMKTEKLQLVIPKGIMPTYTEEQQKELINLSDFISIVLKKYI